VGVHVKNHDVRRMGDIQALRGLIHNQIVPAAFTRDRNGTRDLVSRSGWRGDTCLANGSSKKREANRESRKQRKSQNSCFFSLDCTCTPKE